MSEQSEIRVIDEVVNGAERFLTIDVSEKTGTLYSNYNQDSDVTLMVLLQNARPGGWALIPIVANGDAITIPSSWILYGGDAISIVDGDENHIQVFYKDASTIYYTNKVV